MHQIYACSVRESNNEFLRESVATRAASG